MNLDQLKALGNLGWGWLLVGVVLLLLVWEGGKKWVPALVEKLVKGMFSLLAGTRLVRRFSLRAYREQVELTWSRLPVVFAETELDVGTVYVPLQAVAGGDADDAHRQIREASHAVVLGPPGAGKSMLLRHSMLAWARGPGTGRVPVLLELHRCNENKASLVDLIIEQFDRDGFRKAGRFVDRALRVGGLSVLFDGLDEVNAAERDRVVRLLKDFVSRYPACQVVVTCRNAVYERQLAPEITAVFTVQDFDERLIRRFLRQWPGFDSVEQLMTTLRESPRIMQLARNPLLLTMIAYLYEKGGTLPHSRAEFYREAIQELLRIRKNTKYPPQAKKALLKHLALVAQNVPADEVDRRALPYEKVLDEIRGRLPALSIPEAEAPLVLSEIVERTGLMLAVDGGERYQFAHLSLQEFLAADALEGDFEGLVKRYEEAPGDWREVVKLWCGLASSDCSPLLEHLRRTDALLAFECVGDAQVVDQALEDNIIQFCMDGIDVLQGAAVPGFATLASSQRLRGRRVYEFLLTAAVEGRHSTRGLTARQALAATRLPRAAKDLFGLHDFTELARMGDIAVPSLTELIGQGDEDAHYAAYALYRIGTPASALVLAAQLDADTELAYRAAWYLAELVSDAEIEAALDEAKPVTTADVLDWVWAPFAPQGTVIRGVMGRVAQLIDTTLVFEEDLEVVHVDPRLALPLSVVWRPPPRNRPQRNPEVRRKLIEGLGLRHLPVDTTIRQQHWIDLGRDLDGFRMHRSAPHLLAWMLIGLYAAGTVAGAVTRTWYEPVLGSIWGGYVAALGVTIAIFNLADADAFRRLFDGVRNNPTGVGALCLAMAVVSWPLATVGLAFAAGAPLIGWGAVLAITGFVVLAVCALVVGGLRRERKSRNPLREWARLGGAGNLVL